MISPLHIVFIRSFVTSLGILPNQVTFKSFFMKTNCSVILASLCFSTFACQEIPPVQTFSEAHDPVEMTPQADSLWKAIPKGINAAWGSTNFRYSRSEVPAGTSPEAPQLKAWRGEKVSAQLLVWNSDSTPGLQCTIGDFKSKEGQMPGSIAQARFVRYTLSDQNVPGFRKGGPQILAPDMLDSLSRFDMPAQTTRPIWITINVPRDAAAGTYQADVEITNSGRGSVTLPIQLTVLDHTLPAPEEWEFHLDLWQHPAAVARAEQLELWSNAHFNALRETMIPLAKAGQKVITATLNKDPWNHQCYDGYEDMIKWTLRKDNTWSYDYTIFDRWVELMMSIGINGMINCYSMVPWNCELHYMDEAKGEMVTVKAEPGKPEFEKMWEPFLFNFKKHLSQKGWLGITNIAMDERSPEAMDAAVKVLQKCAPEMGFAIADNHKSYKKYNMMRDVCVAQQQKADHEDIVMRREQGYNTTFYVCCGPYFPNTFTYSHPFEAELLGWYAIAYDYDGMLRWAYNSWPENPQYDSRYGNWSSGDTYLVYPYRRSSIRFERLIDGIEAAEKIRVLRKAGTDMKDLDMILDEFRKMNINDYQLPWSDMVDKADNALNQL